MTSRACAFVAKWCRDRASCSRVEKDASEEALSKHDPTRPIDCRTPSLRHIVVKSFAVYVDPWPVWKVTPSITARPPRTAAAIFIASMGSSASGCSGVARPHHRCGAGRSPGRRGTPAHHRGSVPAATGPARQLRGVGGRHPRRGGRRDRRGAFEQCGHGPQQPALRPGDARTIAPGCCGLPGPLSGY
jgi:hypothetical protein